MAIRLNLSGNGYFASPSGWPLRLCQQTDLSASGTVSRRYSTISATLYADKEASVTMALYSAPLLVGGSDNALLASATTDGVLSTEQTLTLEIPTGEDLVAEAIEPTGTITISAGSQTVTGSGTTFKTDGQWNGYEIQVKNGAWHQIASVASTTSLTINTPTAAIAANAGAFYVRRPRPVAFVFVISASNIVGVTAESLPEDGIVISKIVVD